MMKYFIDTNILLDWLIPTNRFHTDATKLISCCINRTVDGFVSSHSLTDIFYISRKYFSLEDRRLFLILIVSNFTIVTESQNDFLSVLTDAGFFDLEDGLQIQCARNATVDYIVTEDSKGFSNSAIQAINIANALSLI